MLAVKLRQRRIDAGALTLASTEVRFTLDEETHDPTDIATYNLKASNALVEEWMLIANITVSKKVLRHFPTLGILRRHQPPSKTQFSSFLQAAQAVGISLNIDSSKTLADSLDRAIRPEDPNFNKLLRILSTRCMMPAQYFCSGDLPKDQWHHYGLATPLYTHFTSPIRRYADLLVHRLLAAAISVTSLPVTNADRAKQHEICAHMNRRHKAAQHIQRASVKLNSVLFFSNRPSVEPAYILSVQKDRLTVLSPKYGIESVIPLNPFIDFVTKTSNPLESVVYEEQKCEVTISCSHSTYRFKVFDQISVYISVQRACPEQGRPTSILMVNMIFDNKVIYDDSWKDVAELLDREQLIKNATTSNDLSISDAHRDRNLLENGNVDANSRKRKVGSSGPAVEAGDILSGRNTKKARKLRK